MLKLCLTKDFGFPSYRFIIAGSCLPVHSIYVLFGNTVTGLIDEIRACWWINNIQYLAWSCLSTKVQAFLITCTTTQFRAKSLAYPAWFCFLLEQFSQSGNVHYKQGKMAH